MSSAQIQNVVKLDNQKTGLKKELDKGAHNKRGSFSANCFKNHKHEFKNNRKRSQSFTSSGGKLFLQYKRRKKGITLPTKFLLGGNITDPLNLNSLQDEEINRAMNAVTPKSSPVPTPPRRKGQIEVIIPPNIHDPLNLAADDATYEQQLCSPVKRGRKKSNRKNKRTSSNAAESADESKVPNTPDVIDGAKIPDPDRNASTSSEPSPLKEKVVKDLKLELLLPSPPKEKAKRKASEDGKEAKKPRRLIDSMDKIVSPVIPQPGAWKRPPNYSWGGGNSAKTQTKHKRTLPEQLPVFKEKSKEYQYGNYNRYYGYRNPHAEVDLRLKCFAAHWGIFHGKDVLDIGCNIGHITLCIARDFDAKSIVGIDIDKKLINIARKNIRYYVNCSSDSPNGDGITKGVHTKGGKSTDKFFPISMPILYGPVDVPGVSKVDKGKGFPHNVTFVQGNYVLDDDELLTMERPQFDVILALSITKWIHLNWGDTGLKQAFRRMYAQLRPGGKLILEPQAWSSYAKKKKLTETTYKNYKSIEFFPQNFTQYLLSSEVGFAKSEILGAPSHHSKGFQRPILVFTKSNLSPEYSNVTPCLTLSNDKDISARPRPSGSNEDNIDGRNDRDLTHEKTPMGILSTEKHIYARIFTPPQETVTAEKENLGGDAKENLDGDAKENSERDAKENLERDAKENLKGDTKENFGDTKKNLGDAKENLEGDAKENLEGDAKENLGEAKENLEGDAKENLEGDPKENFGDAKENLEGDAKENLEGDAKKNLGEAKENLEDDAKENLEADAKENLGEAKENLEGDAKENFGDAKKNLGDVKENLEADGKKNLGETKENLEGDAKENLEEDAKENLGEAKENLEGDAKETDASRAPSQENLKSTEDSQNAEVSENEIKNNKLSINKDSTSETTDISQTDSTESSRILNVINICNNEQASLQSEDKETKSDIEKKLL